MDVEEAASQTFTVRRSSCTGRAMQRGGIKQDVCRQGAPRAVPVQRS
jgi:hypothetical protein